VTLPSTIVELRGDEWKIARLGGVSAAEIAAVLA
jgi:tRNA A37 threonylcarbamoyladenosine synthetase subunit TsaC/SUA5/YrdC